MRMFRKWFVLLFWYFLVVPIEGDKTDWEYYPNSKGKCKYGIVMGGTPNMFVPKENSTGRLADATYTSCVARLYARHHGYAFTIEKDLGSLSNRTYGSCSSHEMSPWNKVVLWKKYLPDVEYLIWLDLDALINDGSFDVPITKFLPKSPLKSQAKCLPRWNGGNNSTSYGWRLRNMKLSLLPGFKKVPFLYIGEDVSVEYPVNVNSAIIVLQNVPKAIKFLDDVWNAGNDPDLFKNFDIGWKGKVPCAGYYGWPWEQGGIWEILWKKPKQYLSSTCILSNTNRYVLNNVHGQPALPPLQRDFDRETWPGTIVFAYHHSNISPRYMLKRLMILKYISPEIIKERCQANLPPPYQYFTSK